MPDERHVEIDEVHEAPAEAEDAEAQTAVAQTVAAEAAVALANTQAAAAELDAAERLRRFEAEHEEWKAQTSQSVSQLNASLQTLREVELSEMNVERLALAESLSNLAGRLEALESRQSIPPQSTPGPAESETLAGGSAAIVAGPAEIQAGASLDGSGEAAQTTSPSAHPVRRRRWI